MHSRIVFNVTVFFAASLFLVLSSGAWGQNIRFCPGSDRPIAFNSTKGTYEEWGSFDPHACADEPCIEILHNIFEPLVSTSNEQILEPQLAKSWQQLDRKTFRFKLRRNVTFHNGERFDAEAVCFSLMRASKAWGTSAYFPEIAWTRIVDPFTVDVSLKRPDGLFLYRLGLVGLILPPMYFRQVGPVEFGKNPVGTGAFRFVRCDPERREIHLKANPSYWRKDYPKVEHLTYSYMNSEEALKLLIDGKLDLIRRLNPRKTTEFMQTRKGKVVKAWLPFLILGTFNLLKPQTPLRDLRVRQAINLAINREHLIRFGTIGNGRLIGGYTVPEDPNYMGLAPYPHDLPKARQLIQKAGYTNGFRLSAFVDKQVAPQIENIISVCLQRIGISVDFRRGPVSDFVKEVYLPKFGSFSPPSFDIMLLSVPVGTVFHSGMIPMLLLYSREPNESTLRDPFIDELYEEALCTYDSAKASVLWKKLERYVYDKHLLLTGYQEKAVYGANKRLLFTPRTLISFWDAYYEE